MMASLTVVLAMSTVVAAGTFVQASIGFGLNILLVPCALLLWPGLVPAAAIGANLVLSAVVAAHRAHQIDRQVARYALAGSVPGTAAGMVLLASLTQPVLGITAALAVLAAVIGTALGFRLTPSAPGALAAGLTTGLLGTTTGVNGPPMALIMHTAPPERARATVSLVGAISATMSLAAVVVLRPGFGLQQIGLAVYLVPGSLVGWVLARSLGGHLNEKMLRATALSASTVSALGLLWQSVVRL